MSSLLYIFYAHHMVFPFYSYHHIYRCGWNMKGQIALTSMAIAFIVKDVWGWYVLIYDCLDVLKLFLGFRYTWVLGVFVSLLLSVVFILLQTFSFTYVFFFILLHLVSQLMVSTLSSLFFFCVFMVDYYSIRPLCSSVSFFFIYVSYSFFYG